LVYHTDNFGHLNQNVPFLALKDKEIVIFAISDEQKKVFRGNTQDFKVPTKDACI
jgi:hypothetical protein